MRCRVALGIASSSVVFGACRDSTSPTAEPFRYRIMLVSEFADRYIQCPTFQRMYCTENVPDSTRDSLVVQVSPIAQASTLVWNGNSLLAIVTPGPDGRVNIVTDAASCLAFILVGTDSASFITGTWKQFRDCHGATRSGHFTGQREH